MAETSKPSTAAGGDTQVPQQPSASDMQLRVREMLKRAEKSVREARELGRGLSSVNDSDLKIRLR